MVVLLSVLPLVWASAAGASAPLKAVRYRGYSIRVPRSWPVYDLRSGPSTCVRFNRHAVYLGRPGPSQLCPPGAAGRTEAILLEPLSDASSGVGMGRTAGQLAVPAHGVHVTATWSQDPGVIERALNINSLSALRETSPELRPRARAAAVKAQAAATFTGLGFDACAAPSASTMSAWGTSPYRAIGIYVGGENMACGQANLSSGWVATETSAGWHLIPTYVGLQAPFNGCGCRAITPSQAKSQGTAAASTAAANAGKIGIGPGNPIYFDMENYSPGGSNTRGVLNFLAGWTSQLHALGYLSGVYSNSISGISDLVSRYGTSYPEPDDIWMANWNGRQSTIDAYVPSNEWANHQRLHQYAGGHNATYGGRTLNIDSNYVDAATVGTGAGVAGPPPASTQPPAIGGTAKVGWTLSVTPGTWGGLGISYSYQWQQCRLGCANIAGARAQRYKLRPADVGETVRVRVTATNGGGSAQAYTNQTGPIAPTGYWLYSAYGNVYSSSRTIWMGSASTRGVRTRSIVGMASTFDGRGYWQVSSTGTVYAFGDAPALPWHSRRVIGIAADPLGGYWLFNNRGNVYPSTGAGFYGSVPARHVRTSSVAGMASSIDGRGYWLVSSTGRVRAFGDAAKLTPIRQARTVEGIVADPNGGYWLFSSAGNVYASTGAGWFGSAPSRHVKTSSIVGMASTADGGGYWLVSSSGAVYPFGDAARLPALAHASPVLGIAAQP